MPTSSFSVQTLSQFESSTLSASTKAVIDQPSAVQTPLGFAGSAPLTIGGIGFTDFSIPEVLNSLGGTQSVAVHQFPGGLRTSQSLGAFPAPLSWKGTFLGTNAFYYASAIEKLRSAGKQVDVTYSNFKLKGVITKFFMIPKNQWFVPYEISLIIIKDESLSTAYVNAQPSAEALLSGLSRQLNLASAGAANGYVFPSLIGGFFTSLSSLSGTLLGQFGGLVANIPPALQQTIFNGVGYAVTASQMFANGATPASILSFGAGVLPAINALSQVAGLGNFTTSVVTAASGLFSSISGTIDSIAGLPQTATTQSALSDSMSLASQASSLLNPSAAIEPVAQVQTINPNLFQMASQYYSDPTLWNQIASANGLLNPAPAGIYNLTVPGVQTAGGGA